MQTEHLIEAHPKTRVAFSTRTRTVIAQHTPMQNRLLAALPLEDYERLLPYLEPVSLPQGWTVYGPGARQNHLYFLTEGIVTQIHETENGASTVSAFTGSEGIIGFASFLGGESIPNRAMVLSAGYAYRLRTALLKSNFKHGALLPLLLRYTLVLIAQIGQTAVCNRLHSMEKQLCGFILSCLDRLPSNELTITQERISDMLGVRRESISAAAGHLHKVGLINWSRGHITVVDRPGLEKRVCECYAVVKREYDRLRTAESPLALLAATTRVASTTQDRHSWN